MNAPIKYASGKTHPDYKCSKCDKQGVKLWRDYNCFLNHVELYCATCAMKLEKKKGKIDAEGYRMSPLGDKTDQIGFLIPAVPLEEGDTYWGYSCVPQAACAWWRQLPTDKPTDKPKGKSK